MDKEHVSRHHVVWNEKTQLYENNDLDFPNSYLEKMFATKENSINDNLNISYKYILHYRIVKTKSGTCCERCNL